MIFGLPPPLSGLVLDARHLSPQGKRPIPKQSIMRRFHVVMTKAKQIFDGAMDGKETLRPSR
jgi:hypothetical protein